MNRNRTLMLRSLALAVLFSLSGLHDIKAGAGDLDPQFGNGGKVTTDFGNDDYGFAVALQSDGKIVTAGQSGIYPLFHSALTRYNRNGSLDQTFGSGGKVIAALDAGGDQLVAIALQPDGKIVAAGSLIQNNGQTAFLVARFNPDGSLDQTFGSGGSTATTFNDPSTAANDLALQPDGKIILVGVSGAGFYSELNDFALARYNADGSLDQSFGNGGKFKTHFPGVFNTGSTAGAVVLQADGKLVVAGSYKNEGTPHEFALARYNVDGSLDATFGSGGKLTTKAGIGDAFASAVTLQRDGRIVLAGYSEDTQDHDFALACYSTSGTLDQSFGNGGLVATDFSGSTDDIAYALAVQRDGKLIVGGRTGEYPAFVFGLARYGSNGQLDQSFGSGGKVATDFGNNDQAYAVALQRNGKIVLAGLSFANGSNYDFALARYLGR